MACSAGPPSGSMKLAAWRGEIVACGCMNGDEAAEVKGSHSWRFFRAGGFDQVRLETGADLVALDELDQKLWVALACPTTGLEFDSKTLALIDTDKDGRIRAPEIIAAAKWAASCLKNPDDLLRSSSSVALSAINNGAPAGKVLLASAKHILAQIGKPDAASITTEDTADTTKIFAQMRFNGDGIVPAATAADEGTRGVINDIIACLGAEADRSGQPGAGQAKVDHFFAEAQAYSDWWKQTETDSGLLALGPMVLSAATTYTAIKPKVEDYFTRCRLAAFDARSLNALNRDEKDYAAMAAKDLTAASAEIAGLPLAQAGAGKPLPLKDGVNPAWVETMSKFEIEIVKPMLDGQAAITERDWATIRGKFAPYEKWEATKPVTSVEKLGLPRVREILGGQSRGALNVLIAQDKALEPEANAVAAVDRLVRYHRDLYKLLNNFVAFRDFYGRKDKAIFQAGTLYLDQRSCDLCLTVEDSGRHALMAALAGTYLAYCDCVRKATGEKLQIVAAFTGGDSDNLMVGRNGIFYDRGGRDWDATITKLIENPISISQAFWAPYKKVVRMIEEQVAKRAAAADAAATQQAGQAATAAVNANPGQPVPPPPAPAPPPAKMDTGTLAAIGLVLTTLLAALGGIFGAMAKLPPWQVPLAIVGILLAISLPSMLLAWLKLRKRNLGPLLDANGWAVNARARINVPFGRSLTRVGVLPPGSQRDLADPFAEKSLFGQPSSCWWSSSASPGPCSTEWVTFTIGRMADWGMPDTRNTKKRPGARPSLLTGTRRRPLPLRGSHAARIKFRKNSPA